MTKKKSKNSLVHVLVQLLVATIFAILIVSLFQLLADLVKGEFGPSWLIFLLLVIALVVLGTIFWKVHPFIEVNKWFFMTMYLMLSFTILGVALVQETFHAPKISFYLNNASNVAERLGEITCPVTDGKLLVGHIVGCSTKPVVKNITRASIGFVFNNGSLENRKFENLYFTAQADVKRVDVRLEGFGEDGTFYDLSTSAPFRFINAEEDKERMRELTAYLIGVLAVAMFSVPIMMKTLRDLFDDR